MARKKKANINNFPQQPGKLRTSQLFPRKTFGGRRFVGNRALHPLFPTPSVHTRVKHAAPRTPRECYTRVAAVSLWFTHDTTYNSKGSNNSSISSSRYYCCRYTHTDWLQTRCLLIASTRPDQGTYIRLNPAVIHVRVKPRNWL